MDILHRFMTSTAIPLIYPFSPSQRIYWLYLLSALLLAAWVYLRLTLPSEPKSFRGFLGYCFPKSLYLHRSAVVDYMYFIVYKVLGFFLIVPVLLTAEGVAQTVTAFLSTLHPALGWTPPNSFLFTLLFTLILFTLADFGLFLGHYLQHKISWLWEFHKVHHSAEVLNPLTAYRMHPVDDLLNAFLVAVIAGTFTGLWVYCFKGSGTGFQVMGVNIFVFAYYLFGYNLRHSHVWLDYGPFVDRVFISPAQHQIHHSSALEHTDKNLGFVFSFWDSLFGSLVVPAQKLNLEYGLRRQEDREYQSVLRLFLLPFKKCLHRLGLLKRAPHEK